MREESKRRSRSSTSAKRTSSPKKATARIGFVLLHPARRDGLAAPPTRQRTLERVEKILLDLLCSSDSLFLDSTQRRRQKSSSSTDTGDETRRRSARLNRNLSCLPIVYVACCRNRLQLRLRARVREVGVDELENVLGCADGLLVTRRTETCRRSKGQLVSRGKKSGERERKGSRQSQRRVNAP